MTQSLDESLRDFLTRIEDDTSVMQSCSRTMPGRACSKGLAHMPQGSIAPTEASHERRGIWRRRVLCPSGLLGLDRSPLW
jgi:hypothetical protein